MGNRAIKWENWELTQNKKRKYLIIMGFKVSTSDDKVLKVAMENFVTDEVGYKTETITDNISILKEKNALKNHKEHVYTNDD